MSYTRCLLALQAGGQHNITKERKQDMLYSIALHGHGVSSSSLIFLPSSGSSAGVFHFILSSFGFGFGFLVSSRSVRSGFFDVRRYRTTSTQTTKSSHLQSSTRLDSIASSSFPQFPAPFAQPYHVTQFSVQRSLAAQCHLHRTWLQR